MAMLQTKGAAIAAPTYLVKTFDDAEPLEFATLGEVLDYWEEHACRFCVDHPRNRRVGPCCWWEQEA